MSKVGAVKIPFYIRDMVDGILKFPIDIYTVRKLESYEIKLPRCMEDRHYWREINIHTGYSKVIGKYFINSDTKFTLPETKIPIGIVIIDVALSQPRATIFIHPSTNILIY